MEMMYQLLLEIFKKFCQVIQFVKLNLTSLALLNASIIVCSSQIMVKSQSRTATHLDTCDPDDWFATPVTTTGNHGVPPVVDVAFPMVNIGITAIQTPIIAPLNCYTPQNLRQLATWLPKFHQYDLFYAAFEARSHLKLVIKIVGVVTAAVIGTYGNANGHTYFKFCKKIDLR